MKGLTLRTRITLTCAAVITLGTLLCGVIVTLVARYEGFKELDRQLQVEADHFFTEWEQHGGPGRFDLTAEPESIREWLTANHPSRQAEVATVDGKVLFRSEHLTSDHLRRQTPGVRTIRDADRRSRFLGVRRDGVVLRLAGDLRPVEELTRKVIAAFAAAMPLLFAFAVFSGRWVAGRALEPVRRMATVAERLTAEQFGKRLPVPSAHDEVRRLALVLNDAFERLAKSLAQARRFSADASHELKTPLTVLRSGIESLLESPTLDDEHQEPVAGLLEQIRRLATILESLLLLSRSDAGMLKLDLAVADIGEIIRACIEDARIMGEAKEITFEAEIPASPRAMVDRGRLSQILVNLLDNAVKYNKPAGRVCITVRNVGSTLRIVIGNTGKTIAAEHARHIFERFYRAEHSTDPPGHGLGLSLGRELARAHRGELVLVGSENDWTEFALDLPHADS